MLERAVELCRVVPGAVHLRVAAGISVRVCAVRAACREGVPLLEEALADPATTGTNQSLFLAYLGEAYLLAGRRTTRSRARRALTSRTETSAGTRHGSSASSARSPRIASLPTSRPPKSTTAGPRPATELGMRPLVAHCHLGLGKVYRGTGDGRPQEHLTTAETMYREMDMGFWLEKAEMALGEVRVNDVPAQ